MDAADVLLELGTEELPPRGLQSLSAALADGMVQGLAGAGIAHGEVRSFATPRRLGVVIAAVAARQADRQVERRGPPLAAAFDAAGNPTQAATAFARGCGVGVEALERLTTEKGAWLMYRGTETGAATAAVLGTLVGAAIAALPIAKRMRWGAGTAEFVRPVHWLVLLMGTAVVPCEVLGLQSGRTTRGHRFHAPKPIELDAAAGYARTLRRAKVIASFAARREAIRAGVEALGRSVGGRTLIAPALLEEVTALVEWPVPLAGRFDERFLALPREVVIATVQDHQRYFPVEGDDGRLTRWFITVSNIASRDESVVRAGNERVVRPRLSDAAFFWDQDRRKTLEQHAAGLAGVVFQTKLGSYADKTERVRRLAESIGAKLGGGPLVARAAELCKADLMTAMVGEFPELQGVMGRYYAQAEAEPPELAIAIEEHYLPRFAGDALPSTKTGQVVSLADKLDTLVGIFAIDQKPTGTKDPFGLRRAAVGVLRILLECRLDLDLLETLRLAAAAQPVQRPPAADEVYAFIAERLRGMLLERGDGTTTEMIDAVLANRPHSPLDLQARLHALREFLHLPESAVLTAANKRIANILRKAHLDPGIHVDAARFTLDAERGLHHSVSHLGPHVFENIAQGHYQESLRLLTGLKDDVDRFFEEVMVMDEDPARRGNRLALLRDVQHLFSGVADLSRLPG
jgi:glycyl-tRNA synthetase beta chain